MEIKKTTSPDRGTVRHFGVLEKLGMSVGPGGILCLVSQSLPLTTDVSAIPVLGRIPTTLDNAMQPPLAKVDRDYKMLYKSCMSPEEALTAISHLRESEMAAVEGRLAEAVSLVGGFLSEHPDHVEANRMLGGLYRKLGDRAGALACYRRILNRNPENCTARLDVATEYAALGRYEEAGPLYESVLEERPDNIGARRALASLERRLGNREAALSHFRALLDLAPGDRSVHLEIAADLLALDRQDEASEHYRSVLEVEPDNATALRQLGLLERRRGNHASALSFFQRALERHSADRTARMEVAAELVSLGRSAEGRAHYERLLAEMPDHGPAHRALGFLTRSEGDRAAALAHFEAALRAVGESASLQVDIATELAALGRLGEALKRFEAAISLDPVHVGAHRGLGSVRRRFGDRAGALMHFKYALAHRPDDPDLLFDVAAELAALNRPSEALPLVQSSLSAKSNSVSALMLAGRLHQSLGNPAMALASFEAAAIEAPAEIAPLVEVSQAAELLGDSLRAAAALQSALTLDPDHPSALARCSVLSKRHGEIQDALHYACRAVRSALDRGISHLPGLDILQSLGASRQVEAVYNRALAFWGRQPSVLVRLGEHRLRQGRVREAAAVASELVALDGQCFEFQRLRVRAYVALGDFVMAQASVRDLLARHGGDARAHLLGAQVAEAEWHTEAALAAAQRALSLDPDYLDAHRDAARHALMLLDTDRAARHLDEVPRLMPPHLKRPGYSNRSLQGFARTLLVDYVTNLHALARLRAIPEPDIPSLLELVRQEPGYTAAAITLLVRLQRAGLLSAGRDREGDESAGRSAIPRQIVQYWDAEDPPPDVLDHVASWRDAHPEWTHRLFSDASALSFLEENFSRQVVRAYRAASHASQKADLFRIAYLISRGGYYADVDDLCLSSISSFVPGETELVFAHEYWGSVGNNFLGSVPHHPVMEYALSECVQAILNDNLDSIWLATGPGLITRALAAWLAQSAHDLRGALQRILVLDRHETADRFGPLQPLAYKSTDQHWTAGASWRATPGGHLLRPPFTHADRFS